MQVNESIRRHVPLDRRDFLALAASVVAAPAALAAQPAVPRRSAPRMTATPWSNAIIVNALGGLENPNSIAPADPGAHTQAVQGFEALTLDERTVREAHAAGLTAVNVTIGYVAGNMDPFEYTMAQLGEWEALIRANPKDLLKIYSAADILRAQAERRIGVIYGFQNATMVGTKPERVDIFSDLGVRVVQLTYNPANPLGDGSMAQENRGLTTLGHEVVERLNANRLMVDLSHSGQQTCVDAARSSKQPISINHTGCRALNDVPRNKTDEELRLVASNGGFVGIYFMPFLNPSGHATAEDVVAHIDHAVNVCGEDHVGIGTDGSVTSIDDLEAYKGRLAKEIAARRAAGISAAGERPDTFPFVVDLRGVNQFRELADRLQQRGYTPSRIEKILGRNFLRFANEVWGA
jgi:membrane dipeptidase